MSIFPCHFDDFCLVIREPTRDGPEQIDFVVPGWIAPIHRVIPNIAYRFI